MRRATCLAVLVAAMIALMISLSSAQNDDRQKRWQKLTQPNENHKLLESLVGTWDLRITLPEPGGKATTATGTAEFTREMGGRFVVERVKTVLGGEPFEWMAIHGYDNAQDRFVFVSIDNGGTAIDQLAGPRDGDTIHYAGEVEEMGQKCPVRWVMKIDGKDRYTVEMFQTGAGGAEAKVLELEGKRAS